jgi:hypothetical protein
VVNLVHPLPPALHLDDDTLDGITGPLAEQIAYHRELTALAEGERAELESLIALAGGAPVCEVPLLDHDVHDVDALIELGGVLVD